MDAAGDTAGFFVTDTVPLPLMSSVLADTEDDCEEGAKGRNEDSSPPLLAELSRDDDLDVPLLDCRLSPATYHIHSANKGRPILSVPFLYFNLSLFPIVG
jgi:hypothetical protein